MKSKKLKRCDDCGGKADLKPDGPSKFVQCQKCGRQTTYGGKKYVIKIWNK